MGAAEKQLQAIANAPENWDIPALIDLQNSAGALVEAMTAINGSLVWEGATAEAAKAAFEKMRENFAKVEAATGQINDIVAAANKARGTAVAAVEGLSSATVNPAIVTAARAGSAIVFHGMTLPADGAINIIEGILGNQREEEAAKAVQQLADDLAHQRAQLTAAIQPLTEYTPPIGDVPAPVVPPAPPVQYGTPGYTPSTAFGDGSGGGDGGGGGVGATGVLVPNDNGGRTIFGQPTIPIPPVHIPTGTVSVDGDLTGTLPGGNTTGFPGGSSHFPSGTGSTGVGAGSHGGGLGGSGSGSGGLGAGLMGGGAGAAAVAAKLRLGGGSSGGFGGAGGRGGITGLNGTNGANARLGAGGLGGANGVGAGGSTGLGGSGGVGGTAGANGAAGANGGAGGRLGGGGLLGSQGGAGGAGGGNASTVTSTTTNAAGGRGGSGMMGGGTGDDERDKRVGLGGLMAPKLDDESDAAPRSAGASAGGRDEQPQD